MNVLDPSPNQLSGYKLHLARIAWWLVVLGIMVPLLISLPARMEQLRQDPYQLKPVLSQFGLGIEFFVLYGTILEVILAISCLSIAILIYSRKSNDWIGLLVSLGLVCFLALLPPITALSKAQPDWALPVFSLRLLSEIVVLLIFYLFPDGKFMPPWMRFLSVFFIVTSLLWFFVPDLVLPAAPADIQTPGQALVIVWVILVLGSGLISQVYRYRNTVEIYKRQQTKWVVFGFVGVFLGLFLSSLPVLLFPSLRIPGIQNFIYLMIAIPVALFCWFLFPLSLGISILRYRLWDIDLIVRRTLVYGVLTGLLGLIYYFSVAMLQNLFIALSGQQSPLVIVISTLVIAALFNPLRLSIQTFIDRRFYRQKYDAEHALAKFTTYARDEVDITNLTAAMLGVVEDTIQPEKVSLWLPERHTEKH